MSASPTDKRRGWVLMFTSLGGAIAGFFTGGAICSAVLHAQGRGESHADALPVAAACVAGTFICAIAFPIILFGILSRRTR
jgi:hypothetical protein